MKNLTPREQETLEFITDFSVSNHYSPTIREIAIGINTNSLTHVTYILYKLNNLGYINYRHRKHRTITLNNLH